jgi:hypothetical protein
MPEFAINMGWIFGGTKTKRSTRLARETYALEIPA